MKKAMTTGEYTSLLRRLLTAAGKHWAHADCDDLAQLLQMRVVLDSAILHAVDGMRSNGFTWREIGDCTGTSHAAAIQKWGPDGSYRRERTLP